MQVYVAVDFSNNMVYGVFSSLRKAEARFGDIPGIEISEQEIDPLDDDEYTDRGWVG